MREHIDFTCAHCSKFLRVGFAMPLPKYKARGKAVKTAKELGWDVSPGGLLVCQDCQDCKDKEEL